MPTVAKEGYEIINDQVACEGVMYNCVWSCKTNCNDFCISPLSIRVACFVVISCMFNDPDWAAITLTLYLDKASTQL